MEAPKNSAANRKFLQESGCLEKGMSAKEVRDMVKALKQSSRSSNSIDEARASKAPIGGDRAKCAPDTAKTLELLWKMTFRDLHEEPPEASRPPPPRPQGTGPFEPPIPQNPRFRTLSPEQRAGLMVEHRRRVAQALMILSRKSWHYAPFSEPILASDKCLTSLVKSDDCGRASAEGDSGAPLVSCSDTQNTENAKALICSMNTLEDWDLDGDDPDPNPESPALPSPSSSFSYPPTLPPSSSSSSYSSLPPALSLSTSYPSLPTTGPSVAKGSDPKPLRRGRWGFERSSVDDLFDCPKDDEDEEEEEEEEVDQKGFEELLQNLRPEENECDIDDMISRIGGEGGGARGGEEEEGGARGEEGGREEGGARGGERRPLFLEAARHPPIPPPEPEREVEVGGAPEVSGRVPPPLHNSKCGPAGGAKKRAPLQIDWDKIEVVPATSPACHVPPTPPINPHPSKRKGKGGGRKATATTRQQLSPSGDDKVEDQSKVAGKIEAHADRCGDGVGKGTGGPDLSLHTCVRCDTICLGRKQFKEHLTACRFLR